MVIHQRLTVIAIYPYNATAFIEPPNRNPKFVSAWYTLTSEETQKGRGL